jgi:hypothetical protein
MVTLGGFDPMRSLFVMLRPLLCRICGKQMHECACEEVAAR